MSHKSIIYDDAYYKNCPWSIEDDAVLLKETILEAGSIALAFLKGNDLRQWTKNNNTPVCEGDLAVNNFLHTALIQKRPGYGWLSEETEDKGERTQYGRVWVVDPIDGTRAYIKRRDDWCISIALVENGKPVLGAIYSPASDELYFAQAKQGATLNGQKITVSSRQNMAAAHMMDNHHDFKNASTWPEPWPVSMTTDYINSIALRIARVASGHADICVTLRPKNDWDIAAADLILNEAGGRFTSGDSLPFVYNHPKPVHNYIVATTPGLYKAVMRRMMPAIEKHKIAQQGSR